MPRVEPEFRVHKLNVDSLYPPKKQKLDQLKSKLKASGKRLRN